MGCNTTYIFQLISGQKLAEFTFMFGYTNMGVIVEIMGNKYHVEDVLTTGEPDDDEVVYITVKPYQQPK
jgi:hypothetical protein